ncbi:phosphopantetheine-binding protein [Streptomyces sp. SID8111]|uniref:phosphopantetheine-binding protein n=1 Tax=Streptomyces sp. SID8111 TaxID=2706100 RepID=UPI001943FD64|nr:phosphopantetheine-binding protein [Streptomyces sp. SID8111]
MDRTDDTGTAHSTATETGPATATGPAEGAVLAAIRRHAVAILPDLRPADIVPERTLAELGLNSVDRSEVVTNVMDDLDVYVPITEFRQAMPVGDLVGLFERHR